MKYRRLVLFVILSLVVLYVAVAVYHHNHCKWQLAVVTLGDSVNGTELVPDSNGVYHCQVGEDTAVIIKNKKNEPCTVSIVAFGTDGRKKIISPAFRMTEQAIMVGSQYETICTVEVSHFYGICRKSVTIDFDLPPQITRLPTVFLPGRQDGL